MRDPRRRTPSRRAERSFQYGGDDKRANEEQLRLSGHVWESALKFLVRSSSEDDDTSGELELDDVDPEADDEVDG